MNTNNLRMLFFIRTDLGMTKGKMAAQVGHATQYLLYDHLVGVPSSEFLEWMNTDHVKICLKVSSEEELMKFYKLGKQLNFSTTLVEDKGYTQFKNILTRTVVGWGPVSHHQHNHLTADLKLL